MPSPPEGSFALLGCDAQGVVVWCSGAVEALSGRAPAALLARPLASALPGLDAPARERFAASLAAGAPFRLVIDGLSLEAAPAAGAGAPAWCVALRPAPEPAAALAESEERYRRLVEACPEPIVVHAGGCIRFVNPAAVAMLGASSSEELLGRRMIDFVHPDYHAVVAERVRKMLETGGPALLLEEKILRPDGSVLDVEIAGAAVSFQGEPAIQLVGRDVSERRRAEAERWRLEEQVQEARRREGMVRLAAGVADRLSRLSTELLDQVDESLARTPRRARRPDPKARPAPHEARRRSLGTERLEPGPVRRVGLQMAALTEQLLGYVGRRPAVGASTNLSALVMGLSQGLEAGLEPRVSLSLDLPMGLPPARVNAIQLRRVVALLVHNASDALAPRGGTVKVRTRVLDVDEAQLASLQPPGALRAGPGVALEVSDDGCGMDAATRSQVFDPFFSTKSPERGLGLAEVAGLVGAQGGGLVVESAPGRGTTVRLLFPALAATPAEVPPPQLGPLRPLRRR
ncbi:MAG: PAS domain S-box protein [Deltaproteobacteria bacterium]|nr:PAS domain S-box protein [Deltaproteobacteria bacterium]